MIIRKEKDFNSSQLNCPKCSSPLLKKYGFYDRHLVDFVDGTVVESILHVQRYYCKSCGTTHALVDTNVIPYKIYSLHLIQLVLIDLFNHVKINVICNKYHISFQLIYTWKTQLHKFIKLIRQVKYHDSLFELLNDLQHLVFPFVNRFKFDLFQLKQHHPYTFYLGVCSPRATT